MSEDPSDAGTAIKTFNSKSGAMVVALSELKGKLDYIESTKGD
jgi:hypothetical protein